MPSHLWPRAIQTAPATGWIRTEPDDFVVDELPNIEPTGDGEHLLVRIEKINLTTAAVANQLAADHDLAVADIGFAGMKDKRARTRQWFSLPVAVLSATFPGQQPGGAGLEVLQTCRHQRKLRRGELAGNRFDILVRNISSLVGLSESLEHLLESGAPNYFGAQRFGRDNVLRATQWLAVRRRSRISRFQQGLYLSVLRSLLFNDVLAARVRAGNWRVCLPGDVRIDELPTGPLWGRGRSTSTERALEIESAALTGHAEICEGLEYAGVQQGRRSLVLMARDFSWQQVEADSLRLCFELPAGGYATTLLGELFDLQAASVPEHSS